MQFAYIFQCSVIKNTFSYLLNFINLHLGPKELLYSRSPVNKGKSTRIKCTDASGIRLLLDIFVIYVHFKLRQPWPKKWISI